MRSMFLEQKLNVILDRKFQNISTETAVNVIVLNKQMKNKSEVSIKTTNRDSFKAGDRTALHV